MSNKNFVPKELQLPSSEFMDLMRRMNFYWWYWNNESKELITNDELIELLGYTREEFDPGIPTHDKNIHPEDARENLKLFNSFISGESESYEIEFRLKVKDKWHWYYNRGVVVASKEDGSPAIVGGITMNTSRRYERNLKKAEEGTKFEFIFRNTREPVLIITMGDKDRIGRVVDANDAAARLFDCKLDDLINKNPYDILQTDIFEEREEIQEKLIKDGSVKLELVIKDYNDALKYVEVHSHVFPFKGVNYFISVLHDLTESVKVKGELKASEAALLKNEEILQSLIKGANDRIGMFDTEGNVIFVNDAFTKMLGYSREEYDKLKDKERIHPEDKERLLKHRTNLFKEGNISEEYRAQHKEGHYIHMYSKSVVLKDPVDDKVYVLFIIRDITDRIEFEKQIIAAKEKAIESDKLKSAFLANMSHEIRTPMNSIVGFANLLADEDNDEASKLEYISRINRNSQQLLALISDIIDLAKIESNQLSVSMTPIVMEHLFSELQTFCAVTLEEKKKTNIEIIYDPDPRRVNCTIESDLVRLTQILQNLLNNAIKFTHKGEIRFGYRVIDKTKVRFFVSDTGTGIDRKYFDVIFDQFRQIDGSDVRRYGGTGLGLAICRNLADLLSGRIWVESEKGTGSSFFVELPLIHGSIAGVEEKPADDEEKKNNWYRVLMVDDDQDSLMLVSTMMRNEGIQITTADSGYRALEILEREALPDVVLMDLEMPVLSGRQTLGLIKELYPDLKVIAQSAHALEGDREKSKVSGFDEYISKPYSKQMLLRQINKMLKAD